MDIIDMESAGGLIQKMMEKEEMRTVVLEETGITKHLVSSIEKMTFSNICFDAGFNRLTDETMSKIEPLVALTPTERSYYRIRNLEFLILEINKQTKP